MTQTLADLRYAARLLRRSPGFAAVAVATLALGIGANAAIFSVVNGVLLQPLPYADPDRLIVLGETDESWTGPGTNVSYPNFEDWARQQSSFEQLVAVQENGLVLRGRGEPVRLLGALVSAELFDMLRTPAALGRTFLPDEDAVGASPTVVLGHAFWQRQLGGDPSIVGQALTLDDEPHTVIGVMPAGFAFPDRQTDAWLAIGRVADDGPMRIRAAHILTAVGRLAPGVTLDQAQADMRVIAGRLQQQYPDEDPGHSVRVTPMLDVVVQDARLGLLVLLGGVGFVLLIACANVANLLLARAAGRRKEIAVRRAIGATRWQMIRLNLVESLLLAAIGGAAAMLLAEAFRGLLTVRLAEFVPRTDEISTDGRVLAFAILVTMVTGVLFGLAPALQAARADVNSALKDDGTRGASASGSNRLRYGLVAVEIAVSLLLLVGAGLMIKSFTRVMSVDPGFRADSMLTLRTSLPSSTYNQVEPIVAFYAQLPERLEALPGIESVSAVNALPIRNGDDYGSLTIEGRPFPPGEAPETSFRRILPSYFRTMGIPVLEGREFDRRDVWGGTRSVIVSERMAREHFPDGAVVGTRIKVGPSENEPWLTIVGVVADVRNVGLDASPALATYEVHAQRPWSTMNVVIRTSVEPTVVVSSVRAALLDAEPELLITNIETMQQRISASVAPRRVLMALMAAFAALAVVLAAVGIYGVMSFVVAQRVHEMGIRKALGASAGDLVWLVVARGAAVSAVGVAAGLLVALPAGRVLERLLFEVSAVDAATLGVVPVVLVGVALLASYLPARRAAALDPMRALRGD